MGELNLKPCPMCGSKPRTWQWNHGAIVECWCADHRIQCEGKTLKEAAKAWNRRTGSNDTISRQVAIEAVIKRDANCGIDSAEVLKSLPSSQPEPCKDCQEFDCFGCRYKKRR